MSEAKFTKGVWIADIRGGCCAVYEKSRESDTQGCHFDDDRNIYYSSHGASYNGHHWIMSPESIANAHLIAAAPEMYEMLESASKELYQLINEINKHRMTQVNSGTETPPDLHDMETCHLIGVLLAKARGEQQ